MSGGDIMKFVDLGYVLKVNESKNGNWYVYIVEGKNNVYRVFSKRYFDIDSVVYVYYDGSRYLISDK